MYYSAEIETPRQTAEAEAVETRLEVYPGITEHVWVGFPRGCAGLAHLQVFHQTTQVWPTTAGESYAWDGYVFDFEDRYPIVSEPYVFVIKTWNLDDAYPHTLLFAVTIEHQPPETEVAELVDLLSEFGLR